MTDWSMDLEISDEIELVVSIDPSC